MIKLDRNYDEHVVSPTAEYPGGSAKDCSTSESVDGTPFLAAWMNDVVGAFQATWVAAFGSIGGITGEPDKVGNSDVVRALNKFVHDRVAVFVDLDLTLSGENVFSLAALGLDATVAYEFMPFINESRSTFRNAWVERKTSATIGVHCWSEVGGQMVEGCSFSEGECGVAVCGEAECGAAQGETIKIRCACYNTGAY